MTETELPGRPDADEVAGARLVAQTRMMLRALWASPVRNTPLWLAGVISRCSTASTAKARDRAFEIFSTDLEDAAVVHIGRGDAADPSFTHLVRIVKDPAVRRIVRPKSAETDVPRRLHAVAAS